MSTAVRERTRASTNGRVRDLPPDAEPFMTREARAERAAWRLAHPEAWRAELAELSHFDPEFIYEVAHEYDHDWTTDPDYGVECVDLCEYDEDGILNPPEKPVPKIQERMSNLAADAFIVTVHEVDHEADYEVEVRFHPDTIEFANRVANERRPAPRLGCAGPAAGPAAGAGGVVQGFGKPGSRLQVAPVRGRGVFEYLVYDLGGKRRVNSPRELLLYRLQPDGAYHRIAPDPDMSGSGLAAFWSEVFDTYIRFLPDAREEAAEFRERLVESRPPPRFQWWDAEQGRWRDRETDAEHEQERIGRERTDLAVELLHIRLSDCLSTLVRNRIAVHWRRSGPPSDVTDRLKAEQQTLNEWRALLLPDGVCFSRSLPLARASAIWFPRSRPLSRHQDWEGALLSATRHADGSGLTGGVWPRTPGRPQRYRNARALALSGPCLGVWAETPPLPAEPHVCRTCSVYNPRPAASCPRFPRRARPDVRTVVAPSPSGRLPDLADRG